MTTTYSPTLQLSEQGTGDNSGTWGSVLNIDLAMIDQAVNGFLSISAAGSSNITLTWPPGTTVLNQANNAALSFTGVLTGNIVVFYPATARKMMVWNATTGAYTLTVAVVGTPGATVVVPQGAAWWLLCDGVNVFNPAAEGSTLSATGILYHPSGAIEQWGVVSIPGAGSQAVTFGTPFTTGCVPNVQMTTTAGAGVTALSAPYTSTPTNTGFTAYWGGGGGGVFAGWRALGY